MPLSSFKGEGLEKEAPLESCKGPWLSHPALGQFKGGVPLNLQPKIFPAEAQLSLQHLRDLAGEAQKSLRVRQCQEGDQTSRRLPFPSDEDLASHRLIADPSGEAPQNLHRHK